MRTLLLMLVLLGLSTLAPHAAAEDGDEGRTAAQAARAAFDALKNDSKSDYESLLPPNAELQAMLEKALETLGEEERARATRRLEERGGYPAMLAKMRKKALERFARARTQSAEAFDWEAAEFVGLDLSRHRSRRDGPLELREILFFVRVESDLHEFRANDGLYVGNRWCFPEGISYRGAAGSGARRESEDLRGENDSLRKQTEEMRLHIDAMRKEAHERENDFLEHDEKLRAGENRRMEEAHQEAQRQLEDAQRSMRALADELENRLDKERTEFMERMHKMQDELAQAEMKADRAAHEGQNEASHREALEKRVSEHEGRKRFLEFAVDSLSPVIMRTLSGEDEMARLGAEALADLANFEGARPHFKKLFENAKAAVGRRLWAAGFLARTGDPRPLAPVLREMLRIGVGLSEGDEELARYKQLTSLLEDAGVPKDEISRIARGETDKR